MPKKNTAALEEKEHRIAHGNNNNKKKKHAVVRSKKYPTKMTHSIPRTHIVHMEHAPPTIHTPD